MKILRYSFFIIIMFLFSACNDTNLKDSSSSIEFKKVNSLGELSETKLTFLFLSKPGCPWCAKQKEDFKNFQYIQKFPQYDFIKIESNEKVFNEIYRSGLSITSFPTMFIMQKDKKQMIVLEKLEGYSNSKILEPILDFNKDLLE